MIGGGSDCAQAATNAVVGTPMVGNFNPFGGSPRDGRVQISMVGAEVDISILGYFSPPGGSHRDGRV